MRGPNAERRPTENATGPLISSECEAIFRAGFGAWGIDPVPARRVAGRSITFDRPRAARYGKGFTITVTSAKKPYRKLGRGASTRRGVTVRLPAAVARRAKRRGMRLRAVVQDPYASAPLIRMAWQFRVRRG
jgi:hypothetical protein